MKLSHITLALIAFSFGLTLIYNPHMWFWSGSNLLFAIGMVGKDVVIGKLTRRVEFQASLLQLAKVVLEAKAAVAVAKKKEGAGPWE